MGPSKETSFDWTLLSVADTTENADSNRSPRIGSIHLLFTWNTLMLLAHFYDVTSEIK